jgi:hypothetical protein
MATRRSVVSVVRPLRADAVVAYVTDIEGNLDYFRAWVARSRVVRFAPTAALADRLAFRDDVPPPPPPPHAAHAPAPGTGTGATAAATAAGYGYLVFGGDVCDKGVGDVRVARALTDLKMRHPDRVFLLVGNRDVNKLRCTSELAPAALASGSGAATDAAYPYWVEPAKRVTPAAFLARHGLPDTRAARLRWILTETMGADGTFELRRQELAALALPAPTPAPTPTPTPTPTAAEGAGAVVEVDDDAVVDSYVHAVTPGHPDAFMRAFLEHGQLMLLLGPHLVVHGAVTPASLGRVPGTAAGVRAPTVAGWAEGLNAWMHAQLDEHAARPQWGPGRGADRGGDALMDYGVPGGFGGEGVVYATNLDNGNAAPVPAAVRVYLQASGVSSVVAGHVPHGDCPTVIRTGAVRVLTADTSYSDMRAPDRRGRAVSEVLLYADGRACVHGILADGRAIEYLLPAQDTDADAPTATTSYGEGAPGMPHGAGDPWVGRLFEDGTFVKARLAPAAAGDAEVTYLVARGQGFKLDVHEATASALAARPLLPTPPL